MFAELDSLLLHCTECKYVPFIGGDFNSRLNLNLLFETWHYTSNVDTTSNTHGRTYMTDICKRNDTYPIDHLNISVTLSMEIIPTSKMERNYFRRKLAHIRP